MVIYQQLAGWIPKTMDAGGLISAIRRHFCTPMLTHGECQQQCKGCRLIPAHVPSIVEGLDDPHIRNPYSLLVWKCRNEVSSILEKDHRGEPVTDQLGVDVDRNPFELLVEQL